jgi:hypothetical protein
MCRGHSESLWSESSELRRLPLPPVCGEVGMTHECSALVPLRFAGRIHDCFHFTGRPASPILIHSDTPMGRLKFLDALAACWTRQAGAPPRSCS